MREEIMKKKIIDGEGEDVAVSIDDPIPNGPGTYQDLIGFDADGSIREEHKDYKVPSDWKIVYEDGSKVAPEMFSW